MSCCVGLCFLCRLVTVFEQRFLKQSLSRQEGAGRAWLVSHIKQQQQKREERREKREERKEKRRESVCTLVSFMLTRKYTHRCLPTCQHLSETSLRGTSGLSPCRRRKGIRSPLMPSTESRCTPGLAPVLFLCLHVCACVCLRVSCVCLCVCVSVCLVCVCVCVCLCLCVFLRSLRYACAMPAPLCSR